jgi:alpha-ketoglutarate-dependent taurine dioxygenase
MCAADWPLKAKRAGWLARDVSKEALSFDLTWRQIEVLTTLVEQTKNEPFTAITPAQFRHPLIDSFFEAMVESLKRDKGLVFLRGVPVADFALADLRRLYWGIGTYFGGALSQSGIGDRMGDVTPREGSNRGYTSQKELGLHTDFAEIVSLFCIQSAKLGGENVFASSLKLWEIVERERPDFIPILRRGFRLWVNNEHGEGEAPITPFPVPVFGEMDGLRSVYQGWELGVPTAEYLGEPLSAQQLAAIDFVKDVLKRPELLFPVRLENGEAVFINNFEVFHSRKPFAQWENPAKTRHLLRLWLQAEASRPLQADMIKCKNKSGLLGHDPKPGIAAYQYTKRGTDSISQFMKEYFADFYK